MMKGPGADSEEKHEPVSDIDTVVVDSLKVLDPDGRLEKRPKCCVAAKRRYVPICMARPCGTRWTSKTTNVRAASMYQASEVEQFAPGHHGYPRASEAD